MMAEMLNLLLSCMSAWIVGKVEAPANANMIDPKAEEHDLKSSLYIQKITFKSSVYCWCREHLFFQGGSIHNAGNDDENASNHSGYQSADSDGPEVLWSSHPCHGGQTDGYYHHPYAERQLEAGSGNQRSQKLGDQNNENTPASVKG